MKSSNILVPPVTSITTLGVKKKVNKKKHDSNVCFGLFPPKGHFGNKKTHPRESLYNKYEINNGQV